MVLRRKDINEDIVWTDRVLMKTGYREEIVSTYHDINEGKAIKDKISRI